MLAVYNEENYFQNNLKEAINAIKSYKYELAYMCLHEAIIGG